MLKDAILGHNKIMFYLANIAIRYAFYLPYKYSAGAFFSYKKYPYARKFQVP